MPVKRPSLLCSVLPCRIMIIRGRFSTSSFSTLCLLLGLIVLATERGGRAVIISWSFLLSAFSADSEVLMLLAIPVLTSFSWTVKSVPLLALLFSALLLARRLRCEGVFSKQLLFCSSSWDARYCSCLACSSLVRLLSSWDVAGL